jgi:TPR repeat protein
MIKMCEYINKYESIEVNEQNEKINYMPIDSDSTDIEENDFSLQQIWISLNNNNEIFCEEEKDELTQNPTSNSDLSNCAYTIGSQYYNQQNYTYMKKYFQIASNLGNTKAMDNLGIYYTNIEKDYLLMKKYFLQAIEHGNINSMVNLGIYYANIEKDYLQMKKYFLMAIEQGNSNGMNNLAKYYQTVEKDYELMEKYYQMAINQCNVKAICNLGTYHHEITHDYEQMKKYYLMDQFAHEAHDKYLYKYLLFQKKVNPKLPQPL